MEASHLIKYYVPSFFHYIPLKLEIDAEVPGGLDRSKVRTILENANTLGFIDKEFK